MYKLAYLPFTYIDQYCLELLRLALRPPLKFMLRAPPAQSSSSSSPKSPPTIGIGPVFRPFLGVGRFRFIFAV